jgi:hypothetical protein
MIPQVAEIVAGNQGVSPAHLGQQDCHSGQNAPTIGLARPPPLDGSKRGTSGSQSTGHCWAQGLFQRTPAHHVDIPTLSETMRRRTFAHGLSTENRGIPHNFHFVFSPSPFPRRSSISCVRRPTAPEASGKYSRGMARGRIIFVLK